MLSRKRPDKRQSDSIMTSPGVMTSPAAREDKNISFSTPLLTQITEKRKSNMAKEILNRKQGFGTPSYPSPLDCIRDSKSKLDRAEEMGLVVENEASFELNQSFPKVAKSKIKPEPLDITTPRLEQFECEGVNDVSFSAGYCKGSFSVSEMSPSICLNESWSFYNYIGGGESGFVFPQAVRNPNKAICTINAKTSEILVANEMACLLFNYDASDLIGLELRDMIQLKSLNQLFVSESHLETTGEIIEVSGKVIDICDSEELMIPVSLWVKKIESDSKDEDGVTVPTCLCVMEPVERTVATVTFNTQGRIITCDDQLAMLHGYTTPEELFGLDIHKIIPKLKHPSDATIPKEIKNQTATGRTKDGASFPLSIQIRSVNAVRDLLPQSPIEKEPGPVFYGIIWVFANISGMVCFRPDGKIHSINETFARMLFGFNKTELIGKDISTLIPDFYDILDLVDDGIALPPVDEEFIPIPIRGEGDGAPSDDKTTPSLLGKTPILDKLRLHSNQTSTPNKPPTLITLKSDQPFVNDEDCVILDDTKDASTRYITINDSSSQLEASSVQIISDDSQQEPIEISSDSIKSQNSAILITSNNSLTSFESSGNGSSLTETSLLTEESSDDGAHADISGDNDTSFVGQSDVSRVGKEIKKTVSDMRVNMTRKKILNQFDDSSSSSDTSGQVFDEKVTSFLPLFSKRLDSQFFNSDAQVDDESSYFSRESSDTHSSRCSSGHSSDETQPSLKVVGGDMNIGETVATQTNLLDKLVTDKPELLNFTGQGRHADSSWLGINFQIKKVEQRDGSYMFCMWVSRDPQEPGEGGRSCASLTLASSFNSTINQSLAGMSLGEALVDRAHSDSKVEELQEDTKKPVDTVLKVDLYSQEYDTLSSIGKGAFGFVKLARHFDSDREVVVKFIQKKKVKHQYWVEDNEYGGVIPLEVSLLRYLDHPNIVKVIDVYENEKFIQMVMQKHGLGMDLFEFIDRCPRMDEALASYIFRQMVDGISYLHSRNILHRDVKDENIILDEQFHIKLIDFGAAAYMESGKLFGSFCGTLEYCSPEVIKGNKYRGPELEVWSMGVTLYTLVFGENPFFDLEEIKGGVLNPPCRQSTALMFLISWLLNPDPKRRATIQDLEENAWVNQELDITQYIWEEVLPNCEFTGNTACDNRDDLPDGSPSCINKNDTTSGSAVLDMTDDNDSLSQQFKQSLVLDDSSTKYF